MIFGYSEGSKCYRIFSQPYERVNYATAKTLCATLYGGVLAVPASTFEMTAIKQAVTYYAYLDFTDIQSEGAWRWPSGETSLYGASWNPGQPNGASGENCGVISSNGKFQ